jgi:hypothetical protein
MRGCADTDGCCKQPGGADRVELVIGITELAIQTGYTVEAIAGRIRKLAEPLHTDIDR